MSEINVQLNDGRSAQVAPGASVADALKQLDRDAAKQALAAKVNGREVDLSRRLDELGSNGGAGESVGPVEPMEIEPVLPGTLDGLDVIRHSTAHLLAAAVLDLFPGTKLGIGPALLEDPRYGFFYDVIAPRTLTDEDLPVIEKRMRELAKRNLAYRRDDLAEARGAARLRRAGRASEVRADREQGGRLRQRLLHRRLAVHRLLPRPARAEHEQAERVQAALALGRLLDGRRRARADAAHLRHGLRHAGRAGRVGQTARGGGEERPPPHRP